MTETDMIFLDSILADVPEMRDRRFSGRYRKRRKKIIKYPEREAGITEYKRIKLKYIIIGTAIEDLQISKHVDRNPMCAAFDLCVYFSARLYSHSAKLFYYLPLRQVVAFPKPSEVASDIMALCDSLRFHQPHPLWINGSTHYRYFCYKSISGTGIFIKVKSRFSFFSVLS